MQRFALLLTVSALLIAGLNYNASKSNTGNIVVHPSTVTEAQAKSILESIDAVPAPPTQQAIRNAMVKANIKPDSIKSIVIERNPQGKNSILLLADPADEKAARAVSSRSNVPHN